MLKRVFLFVLTNIAILAMVSIVMAALGQLGVLDLAGNQSCQAFFSSGQPAGIDYQIRTRTDLADTVLTIAGQTRHIGHQGITAAGQTIE